MEFRTLEDYVGRTPLVRLKRIDAGRNNVILAKLEGNNPAGSVKDRPALSMVMRAEARGQIKPGDTLIEATSGNTGIALAMAAAIRGYRMILVMPENQSVERRQSMRAYGAELVLTPKEGGMELARDVAERMRNEGKGIILDQFANPDNPLAHYEGTGPEIWRDTDGRITHFVSSMDTTGTIMGTSAFLKSRNPSIRIVGCQPEDGSQIPGIRKWPEAYLPKIFDRRLVDRIESVAQDEAEEMCRRLAREELAHRQRKRAEEVSEQSAPDGLTNGHASSSPRHGIRRSLSCRHCSYPSAQDRVRRRHRIADRFGARTVFRAAIVIFLMGSIACANAPNVAFLVVARFVEGVGGALMMPVGRLVLMRSVEKRDLIQASSWVLIPAVVGPIMGPPVGGLIITYLHSWRYIFYINLPIGALAAFMANSFVEDPPYLREQKPGKID